MKKSVAFFAAIILILCVTFSFPAGAASPCLNDEANLLTEAQASRVTAVLDEISARQGCSIIAVTVEDTGDGDIEQFAAAYYSEHGYASDGIMLLIACDRLVWEIHTSGAGAKAITEAGENFIGAEMTVLYNLKDIDGAFIRFAKLCDVFLTQAKTGKAYDTDSLPEATVEGSWEKSPRLDDEDDLLTDDEEAQLVAVLDEISERQGLDVVVVTTYSTGDRSVTAFADDYYDYHNYSGDGILLLISMEERDWWISTTGYGITAFTDDGIDFIGDKITGYLSDGDYFDAFKRYAELCDDFLTQAKTGDPYDGGHMPYEPLGTKWIFIALAVGLIIAGIVVGRMASKLKSVKKQVGAGEYLRKDSLNMTTSRDTFLYKNVSRTEIPRESSSSGGGSSTHSSSSGSSHGGGGGKF